MGMIQTMTELREKNCQLEQLVEMREEQCAALCKMLVEMGRQFHRATARDDKPPGPGDVVVETTQFLIDDDAVGILIGHDWAPNAEACPNCHTALTVDNIFEGYTKYQCRHCGEPLAGREVWDIKPLNPQALLNKHGCQRWENCTFVKLPVKA